MAGKVYRTERGQGANQYAAMQIPEQGVCNWLASSACRLNRTIPNLDKPENRLLWSRLEAAKRRLVYALLQLGLPVIPKKENESEGLAFDFLADSPDDNNAAPVLTGHAEGVITINIREADPSVRERERERANEPYRTLLGHLHHERGHYYWPRLLASSGLLTDFRGCFGDERKDCQAALANHYRDGPPPDWQERFISMYASGHPWERIICTCLIPSRPPTISVSPWKANASIHRAWSPGFRRLAA